MGETAPDITGGVRFDIFTREWSDERRDWIPAPLTASLDSDGKMRLHGIASSTIKDRHGDTMLLTALEDMERDANAGLTIFGNHSYEVPEDVYGWVEKAQLKQAGKVDAAGDPIYDLRYSIVMNDENPRAVSTHKAVMKGSKLGISIGAMIPEGGATRDKKSGAYTISHVELVETSIVGIPANPRSWVENAIKSMTAPKRKATTTTSVGSPQLTLDTETGTYRIEGSLADIDAGTDITFGIGVTAEEPTLEVLDTDPEVTDAATCPDCGKGKGSGGGCQNNFHKDVDPDVTDAKVRVIEIDTGDDSGTSSQEASSSDPAPSAESEDGDAAGPEELIESADEITASVQTAIASLDPEVTTAFQQLLTLCDGLTRELSGAIEREQGALAAQAEAERQRDEIVQVSAKLIAGTNAILTKLADQPIGRRTMFREVTDVFADLEGIYSRDFLSLLRSK
jgi:phage head maturation protease